jgi:uncharacterized protein
VEETVTEHKHTNHLITETSPYLLQHAHNPVDWYPWGEAALARAREENKPILLSIGYSACHWCHVMEHESFENDDIARLMNENFVNIKVDREERPDLDQIYMNAVQMMTGRGGWPMTMFLTPEGVPFYGGTYYPPTDRYSMPGFPRILTSVAEAYRSQPDQVANTATAMLGELRRVSLADQSREGLTNEILDGAFRRISKNYDHANGGFGGAPKFPPAMNLEFLLHINHRTGAGEALEMVEHTALKMAQGGMYDQLGGGFHRYSVDAKWLVPHFEKMLYDNALLARMYLHLYQVTGNADVRRIAEETLDYVVREMTDQSGGFYSSQDADSEGEEGRFFVWSRAEVIETLGEIDGSVFCAFFDITEKGNFEGHNILHISASADEFAVARGLTVDELKKIISGGRQQLFALREQRVKPARDEKILTAWNGLMLAAVAEASAILDRPDYGAIAEKNARFILNQMQRDGLLLRTCKNGEAKLNAYLEDYGCLIDGLLSLYEATGELEWIESAISLADKMLEQFWDDAEGGFFFTGNSHERLIVRSKEFMDNATPSGNSMAAFSLLRLALLTANEDYRRRATGVLRLMADQIRRYPSAFGFALSALDFLLNEPLEVVIVGSPDDRLHGLLRAVRQVYLPNRVIAICQADHARAEAVVPLFEGRDTLAGQPTAFVCRANTCQQPVTESEALRDQLISKMPGTL